MDEPPATEIARDSDKEPVHPEPQVTPALTPLVLAAAGATLMLGAVFGTVLVHQSGARFSWSRLGIAGFGLILLLLSAAWLGAPPSSDRDGKPGR